MKDDVDYIRETTLAYGAIMNMMERIVSLADGWEELLDMVSSVFEEEHKERKPEILFSTIYEFLYRLHMRLRVNPEKRTFNVTTMENDNTKQWVRITNYDYKTFRWAKDNGFIDGVANDFIDLPLEKLSEKQINAFKKRAERDKK